VEGWDYRACCEGTATLLQALKLKGDAVSIPKMELKDWPHADYTGYMLDIARQGMPLMGLRDAIEAMRYFKVRYLHLHFHDGSAFYFPLKKYPQAGSHNGAINNGDAFKSWDLEELKKTVAYADARGVTLVPELET
ncbi:MAG: family 20 glycosylhydrolase, partial [Verrucomicrobia bacterium]|nr:family 20 glycosylhydrolase [Verrucomicrobiota bacterium]